MIKNYKKVIVLVLIMGMLFISMPHVAMAGLFGRLLDTASATLGNCLSVKAIKSYGPKCIATILGAAGATAIEVTLSPFLHFSAFIFNASLGFSLSNSSYQIETFPGLGDGWTFSRDLVNIFLIFILLFIAIATILQIESYGARALLVRLIIIALLVNFSFLATQAVIFVSNALAAGLYNGIAPDTTVSGWIFNQSFRNDIAGAIMNTINPQQLFGTDSTAPNLIARLGEATKLAFGIVVFELAAAVIIIIAIFVLIMAAFFFITRMITLWLLLILAPFGFVFLILPLTRGYAQTWWKKLVDQAVFAPVFMFLLAIALIILNSFAKLFQNAVNQVGFWDFLGLIILQSIVVGGLILGTLMVSRSMGIYGAGAAIGMASKGGKMFRGYVGRGFLRAGGRIAEKTLESEGRVARAIKSIPLTRDTTAYLASQRKKSYDDQVKYAVNLSPKAQAEFMRTAKPELQRAFLDKVKDKKRIKMMEELEKVGPNEVAKLGRNMKAFGMDKDVAIASNNPELAMEIRHPELKKPTRDINTVPKENWTKDEREYQEAMDKWTEGLTNKELSQINPDVITNNTNVQISLLSTLTPQRLNSLLRNRDQRDAIVSVIQQQTKNIRTLSGKSEDQFKILLQTHGNQELADRINDNLASSLVTGAVRVRGETGGEPSTPPPAEETEGGAQT